jgi:signal transduction histidine kinase
MKIIHRTIVLIVLISLFSVLSLSLLGYLSMLDLEEEASDRASSSIGSSEERKLLDLSIQKAGSTNEDLKEMMEITETIASLYNEISILREKSNGTFQEEEGLFYMEGDVNINSTSMVSGFLNGLVDIQVGIKEPVVVSEDGTERSGNWTFINGTLSAMVTGLIVVPDDVIIHGYLNGVDVDFRGGQEEISGFLEIEIAGDERFRDPGILVRGSISGYHSGIISGPIRGEVEGEAYLQLNGHFRGTVDGFISDTPQIMDGVLKGIDVNNDRIDSAYIGSEQSWKVQNEEQTVFLGPSLGYQGYNSTKRGWYREAVEKGETVITSPYIDATGLGLMITISTPVFHPVTGNLEAVAAVDVTIQSIIDSLLLVESYNSARGFLLNETGWLIAESSLEISGHWTEDISTENYGNSRNQDLIRIMNEIKVEDSGVSEIHVEKGGNESYNQTSGEGFRFGPTTREGDYLLSYSRVNLTGWSLLLMVDSREILQPVDTIKDTIDDEANRTIGRFAILSLLILFFSIFIASLIGYGIILPLERLTSTIKNSRPNELPDNIPGTERNDEIGDLASSFKDISMKMVDYQKDLKEEISIRKEKEEESEVERRRAELYLDLLSHDIGNLHQGIYNSLQLAEMNKGKPERVDLSLKIAGESIRRSLNLVRNILLLSRVKTREPELESMTVLPLIESACSNARSMFPSKEVNITINEKDKGARIESEPIIEQMFLNLIHNGIKFQEGDEANILIVISRNNKKVLIDIRDEGPGIPDADRSRIFGRFTSDEGDMKKGSGLGLHLVKELSDRYRAGIMIHDRMKIDNRNGTVFRITFGSPGSDD